MKINTLLLMLLLTTGCTNQIDTLVKTSDVLNFLKVASAASLDYQLKLEKKSISAESDRDGVNIKIGNKVYRSVKIKSMSRVMKISNPNSVYLYKENLILGIKNSSIKEVFALCFVKDSTTCIPLFSAISPDLKKI
jgi:hypothetical protein